MSNLNLPPLTANTADKAGVVNDIGAILDAAITAGKAIEASVSVVLQPGDVTNYVKLVATNVPAGGTKLTLPPIVHVFILGNDKASAGTVVFQCGTSQLELTPGQRLIAHMDGTANGLEIVSSSGVSVETLADYDTSKVPKAGQALVFTGSLWAPGDVSSGGSGGTPAIKAKDWRMVCSVNDGFGNGVMAMAEFYFTKAGTNVVPTAITTPNNQQSGIGQMIDGNVNSYGALIQDSNGKWFVSCNFAVAVAPDGFTITGRNDSYTNQAPHAWDIEYSLDDGTKWTALQVYGNPTPFVAGVAQTFTIDGQDSEAGGGGTGGAIANASDYDNTTPATAGQVIKWNGAKFAPAADNVGSGGGGGGSSGIAISKLRLTFLPGYGYYAYALGGIELQDADGNVVAYPAGSTYAASSLGASDGTAAAANAFDGNPATYWASGNASNPMGTTEWVEIDMPTPVTVAAIKVYPRQPGVDVAHQFGQVGYFTLVNASGLSLDINFGKLAPIPQFADSENRVWTLPV